MIEVRPGATPADLVPGRPDEVERLGARLAGFAATAADAVSRLAALEGGAWAGEARAMFREAGGEVPARFGQAAAAFAAAARAVRTYGRALEEGQAEARRAVRLVEQSTPDCAEADRQAAEQLVARARTRVAEAGRIAAAQLAQAAADAPEADSAVSVAPDSCPVTMRVVADFQLTDPDGFVAPLDDWGDGVADMRYTTPHEVPFAGAEAGAVAGVAPAPDGDAGWQAWAATDPGRQLGAVESGTLAALGIAAAGLTMIGRQRRRQTALGLVGLDEAELRRRREQFGAARHRDGGLSAARTARLRSADAWRTRLASPPRPEGTVQHWTGSGADRLSRSRATGERSGSVDRDVRGAVLRTGRPAHEGV